MLQFFDIYFGLLFCGLIKGCFRLDKKRLRNVHRALLAACLGAVWLSFRASAARARSRAIPHLQRPRRPPCRSADGARVPSGRYCNRLLHPACDRPRRLVPHGRDSRAAGMGHRLRRRREARPNGAVCPLRLLLLLMRRAGFKTPQAIFPRGAAGADAAASRFPSKQTRAGNSRC